jgi:type IV pilus assembly protein PilO
MPDIKEARRRFTLALIVLLAVSLAAAGVLVSPIGNSSRAGQRKVQDLSKELRTKDREVVPLRGMDKRVIAAKQEVAGFWTERLPSSSAIISERLGKVASETGVTLATGRYKYESADIAGVQRIVIEASVSGDYLQVVRFINSIEREKTFFLIDGVALGEQQGGAVSLQIRMETFLRTA